MIKFLSPVVIFILLSSNTVCYSQSYTYQHETLPCVKKKFSIVAHVFADSLGNYDASQGSIEGAIQGMNNFFAPIMVSFELCDYRKHPNFEHDTINGEPEFDVIKAKYHADYRINFYFLSKLNSTEAGLASGSIGDPFGSGIFIDKMTGISAGVFSHEMGHFCSLAHTFAGNGDELVDGSNCLTAGDGICDTPADPFGAGEPMEDYVIDCRFINEKVDANGEYYNPDLGNIMSYYQCNTCGFTWGQLDKMAQVILSSAMDMW